MAYFGLSRAWIAKYDVATDTYSNAFQCGNAISTSVTPNYNEAQLHGDDRQIENVTEFKNASVTLGTDRLPVMAATIMFGHEMEDSGEEKSNTEDSGNYVGYGFVTAEMLDGKKKYRACILKKVQFKEGEESFETKGDSIVFKTPSLSGIAFGTETGEWRIKSPYYDSKQQADEWIRKKFNVLKQCKKPVASVSGGEYTEAQSVTLTTGTQGAKIRYTTDGTTPSATNGTEYKASISITANTGLRAVAYKEGEQISDVTTEEYFITKV